MKLAALNIVAQPHSKPNTYANLLNEIYELALPMKLRGDRHALLHRIRPDTVDGKIIGMEGRFVTFIDIATGDPWYNINNSKEIDGEEASREISIPTYLKLKPKFYDFYFDVETHLLIFTADNRGNSLSPLTLKSYFDRILDHPRILKNYPDVQVIVVQHPETLEKIWRLPQLNRLEIFITRPNSFGDTEQAIERELEQNKAQSIQTVLMRERYESLTPTDNVKARSVIARRQGYVKANGKDVSGKPVSFSTEKHPQKEAATYQSNDNIASVIKQTVGKFHNG
jgi:hypothetical protein